MASANAEPTVQASQPSRLITRPEPAETPAWVASPRSARNSPNVTTPSPSPNSAPSRAVAGRATLSAMSAALTAQPIT